MRFVDFAFAFVSVDRDYLRHDAPKLLRLIEAYNTSTKMKVRAREHSSYSEMQVLLEAVNRHALTH